jgi:hypothetical protein
MPAATLAENIGSLSDVMKDCPKLFLSGAYTTTFPPELISIMGVPVSLPLVVTNILWITCKALEMLSGIVIAALVKNPIRKNEEIPANKIYFNEKMLFFLDDILQRQ